MPYIKAPNSEKTYIAVPDGLTDDEALAFAKDKYPKLFANVSKAQEGFLPSLKAAGRQLASQYGIAAARPLGMSDEQIRRMVAQEQARQSEIAKAPTWEDVKESAAQYGLFGGEKPEERGGISSLYGMLRGQLAQSLPQMGATIAGGRVGAMAGAAAAPFLGPAAPVAPLVGGALGALGASIPAFVGSGVERQIEEQERAKVKEPLEYGRAVAAAVPSAALDVLETAVVLGRLGMGKMLSSALPKVAEKVGIRESEAALAKAAERSLAGTVGRGAALGVAVEMPTEIAQTVLERWNAKLPLFDEDARKEYEATAVGAGFLGAGFGGIGGISTRGAARDRLGEIQAARAAQEAKQRATQEQAAAQQRAAQGEFEQIPTQFQGQPVQTQTDLFQPVAGVYSPLGQPAAPEEEKPDLREEYRKTKAALDDLSAQMEKAIASKDVDAYATIQPRQAQLQKAVFDIEKEAKDQGIPLIASKKQLTDAKAALRKAMEKGEPAERVQKLAAKVELLQQAQVPGMEGTLFDPDVLEAQAEKRVAAMQDRYFQPGMFEQETPATPDLFAQSQEELEAQREAQKRQQELAQKTQQRQAKQQEAEIQGVSDIVSRRLKDAPLESILAGKVVQEGRRLAETKVRRSQLDRLKADSSNGLLTPELQQVYGISDVTEAPLDLLNPADADKAVPRIQARIAELEQQRKTEFPDKVLAKDGALTRDGVRFAGVEANIQELREMLGRAKPTTPVEEALVSAARTPRAVEAPVPEEVEPGRAKIKGDEEETRRRNTLYDFVEAVDALRKGDFTDVSKSDLVKELNALKKEHIDALINAAAYRRMERKRGAISQDEAIKAAYAVDQYMQRLINKAAERPRKEVGAVGAALIKATEPQSKKVFEAARAVAKLRERIRKAGPEVNVKDLRAQLLEAQKRFQEEKSKYAPSQIKRGEITHGMTISEPKKIFGKTEYAKIRGDLGRIAYELAYPGGKKQVVKGEFQLRPPSAELPVREMSQERMEERVKELRGQADVLDRELARLKKTYETAKSDRQRNQLLKRGKTYSDALEKTEAEIRLLKAKAGISERPGTTASEYESGMTDMFNRLERQEKTLQKNIDEAGVADAKAENILRDVAAKRKNLHRMFDATVKKYAEQAQKLTEELRKHHENPVKVAQLEKEINAVEKKRDKARNSLNTGLTRLFDRLTDAAQLQRESLNAKEKADREAAKKEIEKERAQLRAKPVVEVKPEVKTPTVAETQKALEKVGVKRRVEVEPVRVKRGVEGTDIADIEADRDELSKKIRALGAQLGMDPRDSLRPKIDKPFATDRERRINNARLGLIEKYEELGQQLVIPVPTEIKEKAPLATKETPEETASRVIPRRYAKLLFDVQQVRDKLKDKGLSKVKRKELESERKELNQKIMDTEAQAKRFDVDLSARATPGETAIAQNKAVREALAAEGRKPPVRNPFLKTGSPEQAQAKEEAAARSRGRKRVKYGEEPTAEDLASFEEGEIPISAGRSPISESRGAVTTENPSDKSTVYKELDRAFKGKNAKDRVTVYDTVAEARAAHPDYADEMHKNTRGFTIGDKTFLVAENINKGKALSVLLHELGVHVGFRNFFSPKEFNALVNVVKSWAGRKDNSLEAQVGRAAMERVEAAGTRGEQINDEILAYAVEEAVDAGLDPAGLKGGSPVRNWFNRIVQAFKSALNKLGLAPDTLTAQNLVDFAYGTANMEMGRGGYHGTDQTFIAFDLSKAGTGEGAYRPDLKRTGIGRGPYVGLNRKTGKFYQEDVSRNKYINDNLRWGNLSFEDSTKQANKLDGILLKDMNKEERAIVYKNSLLRSYILDVLNGGEKNPAKNKYVLNLLKGLSKNDPDVAKSLNVSNIKFDSDIPAGTLYATIDDVPDKQVYDFHSYIKPGENRKEDALVEAFINDTDKKLFKYDAKAVAAGERNYGIGVPRNFLFFAMQRVLGTENAALMLKEAGYRAIQRITDNGAFHERAYIEEVPTILAERPEKSVGAAKDILFSRAESKPAWMSQESWDMEQRVIAKDAPLIKTIKGNVLGLAGITQFVDRFAPIKAALERGVANNKITDLEAAQAIYNFSANDKRMNFLRNVVANGPAKLVKKQEGKDTFFMVETEKKADAPTLIKVFKALGESGLPEAQAGRFFTMYMGAQRVKNEGIGVEALNFGKDEKGNPLLTADKLRQFEKDIASQPKVKDAFEKARAIYNEYNKGLIDFAVQTGAISPELAQDLNKKKDYIPFYRQDNGKVHLFIGDEKTPLVVGNLKDQPYLHELIGGDTAIADAFTSSVQNTSMLTDMALRNLATKSTVHMLYKLGMLETATTRAKEGAPAKTYAIRPESGTAGPTVIRFKDKGEDKHVIVKTEGTIFEDIDPELLVKGLEGIKTTFPKALELLGLPAKFLRRAILLSPAYPVRQIVKDSFSVLGTAGADFIPVATPLKNVYSALKGTSKTADTLEKQGLIGGQLLAAEDKEGISTVLRQVTGGKSNISGLIAWLEAKSMMADAGVRASAYDSYRKQGLNELESWIAANELMDFNKRGLSPSMYVANTLVPFFNAQVQGLNVLARAATGRMPFNERLRIQEKFYKRGLALAAMAMLYASMMDDDEAYKNATPQQKYGNWFIRTPFFDEPIKVPIPYEYGLLFKAIPEAIFNTAVKDKPEEYGEVLKALGGMAFASVPGLMPQIAKPFVEAATGVDLYTGEPIESTREKGLDAAQRFRDNTTELSKLLGSIGAGGEYKGISPVMLDHFIKSVGSQTLLASVSLADAVLAGDKPPSATMKTSQTPLLGGFFQPTDAGGIINSTYDLMQKATQSKNTYTKLLEEDGEEAAEQYLNANLGLIVAANSASAFRKQMAEITKYEATIRRSRELTPTEKREMLDDSRQLKIQTATQFREQVRTGV